MHHEEFDVLNVADQERLVARGHHMSRLLVGTEADLRGRVLLVIQAANYAPTDFEVQGLCVWGHGTYRWHHLVTAEPSTHTVVDALGLPPARGDTLEPVALVPGEALRACETTKELNTSSSLA